MANLQHFIKIKDIGHLLKLVLYIHISTELSPVCVFPEIARLFRYLADNLTTISKQLYGHRAELIKVVLEQISVSSTSPSHSLLGKQSKPFLTARLLSKMRFTLILLVPSAGRENRTPII
ncbi:MAG: hypothetical protein AAB899_04640 [Patescibacteria group bacterium]